MKKSRILFTVVVATLLLPSVSLFAADKVVVVPIGSKTIIEASINWKGPWVEGVNYAIGNICMPM